MVCSAPRPLPPANVNPAGAVAKNPPDATPVSPPDATPVSPASAEPLPYFIHRTESNKLPVYHDKKRGGNLLLTKIRKTEGNLTVLRQHLIDELALDPERVYINNLTKQVIIKGHVKDRVDKFFAAKQF